MPEIGEIRNAKDINLGGNSRCGKYAKYIYQSCLGCGKERWVLLKDSKPEHLRCQICSNKHKAKRGELSNNWKGGRFTFQKGYIAVLLQPDNFFYSMNFHKGYVMEHRLIMAQSLGRCLQKWEIVHHKNGIKDDNRIENLELTASNGEHIAQHNKGYKDGYQKGLTDGKDARIKQLEARIQELESLLNASTTLTEAFAKQHEQYKFIMERTPQPYIVS